ncbi:MAG: hypothetical protein K6G88_03420 [Lachnospiraceae bacterium]|nr:hypothetical protein [Lachnospiraceae bacterium]
MGLSKGEINNIKKHIRLHLAQSKLLKEALLFVGVIILFLEICTLAFPDKAQTNVLMGSTIYIFIVISEFVICYGLVNFGNKSDKSMYPGIPKTEFISRIISDIGIITCVVLISGIMDIILFGTANIVHVIFPEKYQTIVFSWAKLPGKLAFCWIIMITAYAFAVLCSSAMNRFGLVVSIVINVIVVIVIAIVAEETGLEYVSRIQLSAVCGMLTVVFMSAAYYLTVSSSKKEVTDAASRGTKVVVCFFVTFLLLETFKTESCYLYISQDHKFYEKDYSFNFADASSADSFSEIFVKIEDDNNNCKTIRSMTDDEAKHEGVIDNNVFLEKDEVKVLIRNINMEYVLYPDMAKEFVDKTKVTSDGESLRVDMPETMTAIDSFLEGNFGGGQALRRRVENLFENDEVCGYSLGGNTDTEIFFIYNKDSVFKEVFLRNPCRDDVRN